VARPALRLLQCRSHAERRDRRSHVLRLVSHYGHDLTRLERPAGTHNMFDERPSTRTMEHLCQRGFQSRAFARRKNHNHNVGICHACIVSVSPRIDNARQSRAVRIEYFIE
jgi:hypothetical protein